MPQQGNILLRKDDATDVTFLPVGDVNNNGVIEWRGNVTGLGLEAQQRIIQRVSRDAKTNRVRVNIQLTQPIMEVIPSGSVAANGYQAAPRVADTDSISVTGYFSSRGTNETRADLARMIADLICGAGSTAAQVVLPTSASIDIYRDCTQGYLVPYGFVNLLFPYD